jgi:3-hydroxyisobutyrate dehydrogenase
MGASIASRLLDSHSLLVTDRNPAAAEELVARGATFTTLDDIAATCRVVFLCLPGPADVAGLLLGEGGLADRLQPGTVVIDSTTGIPTADAQVHSVLRARDVDYVDAPIAGGVRRAREGTATLMVGAAPEVFARIKDILAAVTPQVVHVGPVGTGHAMKLVNNLLNACNRFAALETIRLGEAAGLDRDVILRVLNNSSGRNYATEYTFPQLLSGDSYKLQGFTLALMLKDVRLANELAESLGEHTPIGNLVESFTREAVGRFGPDADQSQMMAEWYQH